MVVAMKKIIWLELNEVNIDFIQRYINNGYLPNFKNVIKKHSYKRTISENEFKNLEPWIQWVTVHTGKAYNEHKIYRLGDAADQEMDQIWNVLEEKYKVSVAAISPMNAGNKTSQSDFFVPDPWTKTRFSGSWDLKLLYESIVAAVNNNAGGRFSLAALTKLIIGGVVNFRIKSIPLYVKYVINIKQGKWYKALILDTLLTDTFIKKWKRHQPDFSTLFLNAGAHIQHHYMFSSPVYEGGLKNPDGYIKKNKDPLLDVYELYDHVLSEIILSTNARVMLVTGLSQKPNNRIVYYYRLKDHRNFIESLNLRVSSVEPRMSRDFLVRCKSDEDLCLVQKTLVSMKSCDGESIFSVDNRGDSLFCMLSYTNEIKHDFKVYYDGGVIEDMSTMVVFVTIENGIHKTDGVLIDTGIEGTTEIQDIPLSDVYNITISHFNS